MVKIVSRSSMGWSRYSPASSARVRSGVAIHYNGGPTRVSRSASHSNCVSYWQNTASYHRSKWSDIGYSWGVCPHGYAFEGRGFDKVQAAQPGGNATHQSITMMIGGNQRPSASHMKAAQELIAWLRNRGVGRQIRGHRDFYNTSCPGDVIYALVRNGSFEPGRSVSGSVSTGGGSTPAPAEPKEFLDMADHVFYRATKPQKMEKGKENLVHFHHTNQDAKPIVTFAFQDKKVMGDVTLYVKGKGRFGTRVVKYKEGRGADLPSGTYGPGDNGGAVTEIQKALLKLGESLPRYGADGDYGSETKSAVMAFQSDNGLAVDGVYGPNTRSKMESKLGGGGLRLVHRHPDRQFRIDSSGESRVSFSINDQTKDGERMRVSVYPIDNDIEVTRAYVDTWQADR